MSSDYPEQKPQARPMRLRWPTSRDPFHQHRAVMGPEVYTPWYIRVRAAMGLTLIVAAVGLIIAAGALSIAASFRVLLEILAG